MMGIYSNTISYYYYFLSLPPNPIVTFFQLCSGKTYIQKVSDTNRRALARRVSRAQKGLIYLNLEVHRAQSRVSAQRNSAASLSPTGCRGNRIAQREASQRELSSDGRM